MEFDNGRRAARRYVWQGEKGELDYEYQIRIKNVKSAPFMALEHSPRGNAYRFVDRGLCGCEAAACYVASILWNTADQHAIHRQGSIPGSRWIRRY